MTISICKGTTRDLALMDEKHPKEPHFYLLVLGTRPRWQSQGIGSALLRTVLDRCDETGMPAYLEASSGGNKRLYLRHAFEVTDELQLRDSPTGWCMWRCLVRDEPGWSPH